MGRIQKALGAATLCTLLGGGMLAQGTPRQSVWSEDPGMRKPCVEFILADGSHKEWADSSGCDTPARFRYTFAANNESAPNVKTSPVKLGEGLAYETIPNVDGSFTAHVAIDTITHPNPGGDLSWLWTGFFDHPYLNGSQRSWAFDKPIYVDAKLRFIHEGPGHTTYHLGWAYDNKIDTSWLFELVLAEEPERYDAFPDDPLVRWVSKKGELYPFHYVSMDARALDITPDVAGNINLSRLNIAALSREISERYPNLFPAPAEGWENTQFAGIDPGLEMRGRGRGDLYVSGLTVHRMGSLEQLLATPQTRPIDLSQHGRVIFLDNILPYEGDGYYFQGTSAVISEKGISIYGDIGFCCHAPQPRGPGFENPAVLFYPWKGQPEWHNFFDLNDKVDAKKDEHETYTLDMTQDPQRKVFRGIYSSTSWSSYGKGGNRVRGGLLTTADPLNPEGQTLRMRDWLFPITPGLRERGSGRGWGCAHQPSGIWFDKNLYLMSGELLRFADGKPYLWNFNVIHQISLADFQPIPLRPTRDANGKILREIEHVGYTAYGGPHISDTALIPSGLESWGDTTWNGHNNKSISVWRSEFGPDFAWKWHKTHEFFLPDHNIFDVARLEDGYGRDKVPDKDTTYFEKPFIVMNTGHGNYANNGGGWPLVVVADPTMQLPEGVEKGLKPLAPPPFVPPGPFDVEISVRASGSPAKGEWPRLEVMINRELIGKEWVQSPETKEYVFRTKMSPDVSGHELAFHFPNDRCQDGEDRNLFFEQEVIINGRPYALTAANAVYDRNEPFDNRLTKTPQCGMYWRGAVRTTTPVPWEYFLPPQPTWSALRAQRLGTPINPLVERYRLIEEVLHDPPRHPRKHLRRD